MTLDQLTTLIVDSIERLTSAEKRAIREVLLMDSRKKQFPAYAEVAIAGEPYAVPMSILEDFLAECPAAEILEFYTWDRIHTEGIQILTPDDIELLEDAGAAWGRGMYSSKQMRGLGLVALIKRDDLNDDLPRGVESKQ
jgi:hypothetical protein